MYDVLVNNDHVLAITTDCNGGVSTGSKATLNFGYHVNDNKEHVDKNYEILAKSLNIPKNRIYYANQTHSDNIAKVTSNSKSPIINTDALYTTEPNVYVSVLTADCLPILLYDYKNNIVAAIHAGWVGSVKLIAYKTINFLVENEGLDVNHTKIYFGPSILQNSYEVDDLVKKQVDEIKNIDTSDIFTNKENGKYLFDNRRFNYNQLLAAGILNENIYTLDIDTYSNDDYFSYRKDKECGRQLSMIGLKNTKKNVRKYMKTIEVKNKDQQSKYVNEKLKTLIKENNYKNILAFIPMDNEPDITPILDDESLNMYVPKLLDDAHMEGVKYDKNLLVETKFGCMESTSYQVIEPGYIDLIIVPGAAFDKQLKRLGHGKGYYDRYLKKAINANKVGITYAEYLYEDIPVDKYDVTLDDLIYDTKE